MMLLCVEGFRKLVGTNLTFDLLVLKAVEWHGVDDIGTRINHPSPYILRHLSPFLGQQ